jgi:hypothetical protein
MIFLKKNEDFFYSMVLNYIYNINKYEKNMYLNAFYNLRKYKLLFLKIIIYLK